MYIRLQKGMSTHAVRPVEWGEISTKQSVIFVYIYIYTIHMYSGITSGRVLNGELLYTKILEVNLFAFAYRLFRRDFSPLDGTCRQMQTN